MHWLGFDWEDREYYASDYFDRLYAFAEHLIKTGHAYVDSQDETEIRATRGHGHRTGAGKPVPEPVRGRKPGYFSPHETR